MDAPLTLTEMRSAVGDLAGALLDHRPLTDTQWDRAVSTLVVAREQHGGRIRQLIHVILNIGRDHDAPLGALPGALDELRCHLAVVDDPPTAQHRDTPPAPRRRRSQPRPIRPTQPTLFDPSPDAATEHDAESDQH
jgi:hypothetical protein